MDTPLDRETPTAAYLQQPAPGDGDAPGAKICDCKGRSTRKRHPTSRSRATGHRVAWAAVEKVYAKDPDGAWRPRAKLRS
jgi:hypothetical protein